MVAVHWAAHAQYGRTALIWAAAKGHADCVRLLLDAGADKEAKCKVRASAVARVGIASRCLVGFLIFLHSYFSFVFFCFGESRFSWSPSIFSPLLRLVTLRVGFCLRSWL